MLGTSQGALVDDHDLAMFDLDGVVYVGDQAVPGVPEHLARVRASGVHIAYVTNNASRPPVAVAERLRSLGIQAQAGDVVTSAQAAAHVLRERFGPGARIAALGAAGLVQALRDEGLEPVTVADEDAVALASGYGPDVPWKEIMQAAVRVRDGLPWLASNADLSLPTARGPAPGHGVLVRMIADFAQVTPDVAGKPERPLLDETVRRVGGERPLMVGDRLDTDIEGANRAGVPSLLVLTGVSGLADLATAGAELRPTYVSADLGGLFERHQSPARQEDAWRAGGWTARVADGRLVVAGEGSVSDWWRAAACALWNSLDATGSPADVTGVSTPGGSLGA